MALIVLEGLDRTGKSTVANFYRQKGYEVIHMSAPDKKFYDPNYIGPSYMDEMVALLNSCEGRDVLLDRSYFGEAVWPVVFGRDPLLSEEDLSVLNEIEQHHHAERILMYDADIQAHWNRIVAFKEKLTKQQFAMANKLYSNLVFKYKFKKMQLKDFNLTPTVELPKAEPPSTPTIVMTVDARVESDEKEKLRRANAINRVLEGRVLKRKGDVYDALEGEIRAFLGAKMKELFQGASQPPSSFSDDETQLLKLYCQRMIEKAKLNK